MRCRCEADAPPEKAAPSVEPFTVGTSHAEEVCGGEGAYKAPRPQVIFRQSWMRGPAGDDRRCRTRMRLQHGRPVRAAGGLLFDGRASHWLHEQTRNGTLIKGGAFLKDCGRHWSLSRDLRDSSENLVLFRKAMARISEAIPWPRLFSEVTRRPRGLGRLGGAFGASFYCWRKGADRHSKLGIDDQ